VSGDDVVSARSVRNVDEGAVLTFGVDCGPRVTRCLAAVPGIANIAMSAMATKSPSAPIATRRDIRSAIRRSISVCTVIVCSGFRAAPCCYRSTISSRIRLFPLPLFSVLMILISPTSRVELT
jgi:hypothetical protein